MIRYAAVSFRGMVRTKNEDNYCCGGEHFPIKDCEERKKEKLIKEKRVSSPESFAVFDGMGGGEKGEVAAFMAAERYLQYADEWKKLLSREYFHLSEYLNLVKKNCKDMNCEICGYAKAHKYKMMGTTVASLTIGDREVVGYNLGDSRIYSFYDGKLVQLTTDHVISAAAFLPRELTQCLGIPESELILNPALFREKYKAGTRYLLCSDGLTDMLSDYEIAKILLENKSIEKAVYWLQRGVIEKGAVDNTTIILCLCE